MEQEIYGTKARVHTAALWADSEPAIGRKSSPSYEVKESDIRRAVAAIADLPSSTLPDSPFILALGRQRLKMSHHKRAPWHREPWRNGSAPCVNKAVAILEQMQAGRPALIQKMAAKCSLPLSLTGHSWTLRH